MPSGCAVLTLSEVAVWLSAIPQVLLLLMIKVFYTGVLDVLTSHAVITDILKEHCMLWVKFV